MDIKEIKENIAQKGLLPCARRLGEDDGLMIRDVRKCLRRYFELEGLPFVCCFVAACDNFRSTKRYGLVAAWLLTVQHKDGAQISTSDAAVRTLIRKLKAEARCQVGTAIDIRVLCAHRHVRC